VGKVRALVVYESMYGNTQAVAEAVAKGLAVRMDVDVVEVGTAPTQFGGDADLVVVGGPTHAFGMSRPATRRDAAQRENRAVISMGRGIREWLSSLADPHGVAAAAFDTRVDRPRVPGSAARAALRRLRKLGFRVLDRPMSFYVNGGVGPLLEGELDRARSWGERLAAEMTVGATR
jgi:hypothetical protein